jgi:hypothetical protein
MCMNCGCGEVHERHKPGDITYEDLQKAAQNHQMDAEKAADNIHASAKKMRESGARR